MDRLTPADYFPVRFVKPADPDTGVTVGYEGIVIAQEGDDLTVEVAPWDEDGEPLVIVSVASDCVERITRVIKESERLSINKRWEAMERWTKFRERRQSAQKLVTAQPTPTQQEIEAVWAEFHVGPTGYDMTNECRLAAAIIRMRRSEALFVAQVNERLDSLQATCTMADKRFEAIAAKLAPLQERK